jgi:hypothetical protein
LPGFTLHSVDPAIKGASAPDEKDTSIEVLFLCEQFISKCGLKNFQIYNMLLMTNPGGWVKGKRRSFGRRQNHWLELAKFATLSHGRRGWFSLIRMQC